MSSSSSPSIVSSLLSNLATLKSQVSSNNSGSSTFLESSLSSQHANLHAASDPMIIHSKTHRKQVQREMQLFREMNQRAIEAHESGEGRVGDKLLGAMDLEMETDALTARLLKKRKIDVLTNQGQDQDALSAAAMGLSTINRAKKRRKVVEDTDDMHEAHDDVDIYGAMDDVMGTIDEPPSEKSVSQERSLEEQLKVRIIKLPTLSKKVEERDIRKAIERADDGTLKDIVQSIHIHSETISLIGPNASSNVSKKKKRKKKSSAKAEIVRHGIIVMRSEEARDALLGQRTLFVRTAQCVMKAATEEDAAWCLSNVAKLQV